MSISSTVRVQGELSTQVLGYSIPHCMPCLLHAASLQQSRSASAGLCIVPLHHYIILKLVFTQVLMLTVTAETGSQNSGCRCKGCVMNVHTGARNPGCNSQCCPFPYEFPPLPEISSILNIGPTIN